LNTLVFDIETVPDVDFGRRHLALEGLADEDVAQAMFALRRVRAGSEFLPLLQHRIVAISCAMRSREGFKVWSLGDVEAGEEELVRRFFDGIERFSPDLVSWNGSGFDLPVLHYRAMRHGISAPRYWELGEGDRDFRFNNYLSRFHWRHTDLMDVLAGYQARGAARLDEISVLLGLPGKLGLSGDRVWDEWRHGRLGAIRDYCETDVLNTWLVFLQFEQFRGRRTAEEVATEQALVAEALRADGRAHLLEFLAAWGRG
jgi:3'-5' exonuclease